MLFTHQAHMGREIPLDRFVIDYLPYLNISGAWPERAAICGWRGEGAVGSKFL